MSGERNTWVFPPACCQNAIHPGDGIWCNRFMVKKGRVFTGPDREHWGQAASIAIEHGKRQVVDIFSEFHGGRCQVHLEPAEYHRFVRAYHFEGTILLNGSECGEIYAERQLNRPLPVVYGIVDGERLFLGRRWDEQARRLRTDFVLGSQSQGALATLYEDGHWPGWKEAWQAGLGLGLVKVGEWTGATTEQLPADKAVGIFAAATILFSLPQTSLWPIFDCSETADGG